MVKILYFAWLRERLGMNEETLELPGEAQDVAGLLSWMAQRDERFAAVFEDVDLIQVAINRKHVRDRAASLDGATEIALFPPMTGG